METIYGAGFRSVWHAPNVWHVSCLFCRVFFATMSVIFRLLILCGNISDAVWDVVFSVTPCLHCLVIVIFLSHPVFICFVRVKRSYSVGDISAADSLWCPFCHTLYSCFFQGSFFCHTFYICSVMVKAGWPCKEVLQCWRSQLLIHCGVFSVHPVYLFFSSVFFVTSFIFILSSSSKAGRPY